MEPSRQIATLSQALPEDSFSARLSELRLSPLAAESITILQINITRQCNLQCRHCHVEAGPRRTEMMNRDTLEQCLRIVEAHDNLEEYMSTLRQAFNPAAVRNLMCRATLSVGWDGRLYDCDFNQMLGLPVNSGVPTHIRDFDFEILRKRGIAVRDHYFACTAGAGSSCQGALLST